MFYEHGSLYCRNVFYSLTFSFSVVLAKLVYLENIFILPVTLWTVGMITQMQIK